MILVRIESTISTQIHIKIMPVYEQFYGLSTKPFSLLPDPKFLFMSRKHALAMSILEYAVSGGLGLSVITGEVGSGKTTLVRQLIGQFEETTTIGLVSNTHSAADDLMKFVALAYGIPFKGKEKIELYQDFTEFLIGEYTAGRRTLLIVDEAQNLNVEMLEEIRLLTNINADEHTLIQLLLVGQPELHQVLKRHELRQLAQRISVTANLEPLDEKETTDYICHRLVTAGGDPNLFHKNALRLVYWNSGGIPRVINTLCELALVYGYADRKKEIDALLIADIARDRIDTGLYGTEVYDVQSLRDTAEGRPRARSESLAQGLDARTTSDKSSELPADITPNARNVVDLVVDDGEPEGGVSPKRTSQG